MAKWRRTSIIVPQYYTYKTLIFLKPTKKKPLSMKIFFYIFFNYIEILYTKTNYLIKK